MADVATVVEVGEAEFAAAVAEGVVVVDVGAEWCPLPCDEAGAGRPGQ